MAVLHDASGTSLDNTAGTNTSLSFTGITVGALSNTALVVFISFGSNVSNVVVHWDSAGANQAMTQIGTAHATTNDAYTYIFGLVSLTNTGNKTITASWTTGSDYCIDAASFTGADQGSTATTFKHFTSSTGSTSGLVPITITSPTNDMAVAGWASSPNSWSTAGITGTNIFTNNNAVSGAANYIAGSGTPAPSIDNAGSVGSWVAIGCDIAAVGTVTGAPIWGFEEEPHRRPQVRWGTRPKPDDWIRPPISFVPIGFDEDRGEQSRRFAWRARPQPDYPEQLAPTVFVPLGFDPDFGRQIHRPWLAHPQPDYPGFLPPVIFVPWGFEEEPHRQERRAAWRTRPEIREDIFVAPTVFVGWGFEEEPHRQEWRVAWRTHPEIREDIFVPPTVFVGWGFDEEGHRQERRTAWRAYPQPNDIFVPPPTVFVNWGFEEERAVTRRPRWLAHPQPDVTDGFPFTTGIITAYPWGFDEEQHRLQRRPWHPGAQADDILNPIIPPFWYGEDPYFQIRRIWRAHPQPDYPEQLAPTVFVPWGFESDPGRQVRRPGLAHPQPGYPEQLAPTVFAPWGFDEEGHRQVRRIWRPYRQIDDLVSLSTAPVVFVPWGFEEESHRQARRAWRAHPETREDIFSPPTVFVPWGFELNLSRLPRRAWRAYPQPDFVGLITPVTPVIFVPWGFEAETRPQQRRAWRRSNEYEFWAPIQPPPTPIPTYALLEMTAPQFILDLGAILPTGVTIAQILSATPLDGLFAAYPVLQSFANIPVISFGRSISPTTGLMQAISGEVQAQRIPAIVRFTCVGSDGAAIIVDGIYRGALKFFY